MLQASARPLVEIHDLAMFDLDGVVYLGDEPVPDAPRCLARTRQAGVRVGFITNNASRPPSVVADRLQHMGIRAGADEVVTSAQAAARLLWERHGGDAVVAVLGADGLVEALREAGLTPAAVDDEQAVSLVSGYGPDVPWHDIMQAAVRVRDGLPWVACNTDLTLPTPHGVAPGHGVLVDLLSRFAGVAPTVAGKPQRPLLDETSRRLGGRRPLMVGDRLDTDIEGAHHAGVDSLLVLTGVTGLVDLVRAPGAQRPTYLAPDLEEGLFVPHPTPERSDEGWTLDGWTASVPGGELRVRGSGEPSHWWRVVACAGWEHLDRAGSPADTRSLVQPPDAADR